MPSFQYNHDPKATEVERKLNDLRSSTDKDFVNNQINSLVAPVVKDLIDENTRPNSHFMEAYRNRKAKEENKENFEKYLDSIDENGFKLEKIYNTEDFQRVHDPLKVFSTKKNYKSLAWKVYTDVHESQTFLKTLYYPELRSEDYGKLLGMFAEEHSKLGIKSKLNVLCSLAILVLGFKSLSTANLTPKSSAIMAVASSLGWYLGVEKMICNRMNVRLNKRSFEISQQYPEIKLVNFEYSKINH